MKSILFLDHFNRHGGAQEYLIDIANGLHVTGFSVSVPYISSETLRQVAKNLPCTNFTLLANSFKNPAFYFNFVKNIFQIRNYCKKKNIDVLHCNSIPALALAKIARLKHQHIVFTCHDCNLNGVKTGIVKRCAENIVCVSETVKQYLEDKGISQSKHIIHNGFSDYLNGKYDLEKYNNEKVVIGLIGRIERWKGCHVFIAAAEKCLEEGVQNVEFHIIGYAEDKKYFKELQNLITHKDKIRFKNFQSGKDNIYTKVNIVVNASIAIEPFGRTLVEAGIYGIPVIGPSEGGPAEIIIDKKTGLLFSPGDAVDLSKKMTTLFQSEKLQKEMGLEARKVFLDKYSIEKTCKELIELYSQL